MNINKKTCMFCQQPITDDSLYICCDCAKKSVNELQETEIGKQMSQNTMGWIILLGIFSGKMDN